MRIRTVVLALVTVGTGLGADWNPRLAAQYLDTRQKDWSVWKKAASADGPCVSCHTGLPYLLARPALRKRLAEAQPTVWETALLNRLKTHIGEKKPGNLQGVEATFTALFLAREDQAGAAMSRDTRLAFDQLWALQPADEKSKGGILWYSAKLDPWESPDAFRWGAALAAMAAGTAPASYQAEPATRARVKALTDYLQSDFEMQPMHHRLGVLWASSKLPDALPESMRKPLIEEALRGQQADGGWTIDSIGPWSPHEKAAKSSGSSAYATGYVAYVLQTAGVAKGNPAMRRALDWLKSHQNAESGAWPGISLNKVYPEDSMEAGFVQDAATAFAAMALLEAGQ